MTDLIEQAKSDFADWFRKNYPGPDTIIMDPDWHAPKIFRAATHQIVTAQAAEIARLTAERDAHKSNADHNYHLWCNAREAKEAAEAQVADAYARGLRDAAGACDLASGLMASGVAINDDDIPAYCKGLILALIPKHATEG